MAWTATDAMVTRFLNDLGADGRKSLLKKLGVWDQTVKMARKKGYSDHTDRPSKVGKSSK